MAGGKRLVLCIDGTWNNAEIAAAETNVARIARAIHAHPGADGRPQTVLYLRGVGTAGLAGAKLIEGAIGLGVDDLIRSGYMFLAQNYEPGDEIFVFGFSRGSFAARSIVGLVAACGLLNRRSLGDLGEAWNYYRTPKPHSPREFVRRSAVHACVDVRISFLGIWDTVGALGIPGFWFSHRNAARYAFHDTAVGAVIDHGYHALAIDEHRADFVPTLWTGAVPAGTTIQQVWFPGAHADVGGGYGDRALADVPLLWMARRAAARGLGIDWTCLPDRGDALGTAHNSSSGAFIANRLHPTWREVCGRPAKVALHERLYRPHDANGKPLAGVNQRLHASVLARWGRLVRLESTAFPRSDALIAYRPRTIAVLLDPDGTPVDGIAIEQ